jgi:hypothetical protein
MADKPYVKDDNYDEADAVEEDPAEECPILPYKSEFSQKNIPYPGHPEWQQVRTAMRVLPPDEVDFRDDHGETCVCGQPWARHVEAGTHEIKQTRMKLLGLTGTRWIQCFRLTPKLTNQECECTATLNPDGQNHAIFIADCEHAYEYSLFHREQEVVCRNGMPARTFYDTFVQATSLNLSTPLLPPSAHMLIGTT